MKTIQLGALFVIAIIFTTPLSVTDQLCFCADQDIFDEDFVLELLQIVSLLAQNSLLAFGDETFNQFLAHNP